MTRPRRVIIVPVVEDRASTFGTHLYPGPYPKKHDISPHFANRQRMDFLTMNLPKSRRGLLLSLANSKAPTSSEGRNPPSIVTDHDGNRLFGRDFQRTQGDHYVSPTHDSEGMRSTIQKSKICALNLPSASSGAINTWTIHSSRGIREPDPKCRSAERDFVTSMQSTVSGVGRTNHIFGAVPSRNDQTYRLRSIKLDVQNVASPQAEEVKRIGSPSTPNSKPKSRGGENRVMFSSQGRWSTFFSEADLQKPAPPDWEPIAGIADSSLLEDSTGNASPKSRTSSTFESDGIRTTMRWRSRALPPKRHRLDPSARGPTSPTDTRCPLPAFSPPALSPHC